MKRLILYISLFFVPAIVSAQGLFENTLSGEEESDKSIIDFSGYARGSAYGYSKFYDYTSVFGEFMLQGKLKLNNAFLFSDIRFRGGLLFDTLNTTFQLKEAYAGFESKRFDIYLGQKIITWGRTDGFNPTNYITPTDYFFLTADPDDQKLSNFLMQSKIYLNPSVNLEIIAIPFYRPSVYRYDLFDLGEYTSFKEPVFPEARFKNGSLAARMDFSFPALGFAISWFRGYDPLFGFNLKNIEWAGVNPTIELNAQTYHKNTFGLDFSLPVKSVIVRGEAVFTLTKDFEENMYIPNPGLYYVGSIEKTFYEITAIAQYIGAYTVDFRKLKEPVLADSTDLGALLEYYNQIAINEMTEFNRRIFYQQEQFNHAFSLSLSRAFAHQTVFFDIMGYYNVTSEEYFIRPEISWKINDNLVTTAGGFYSEGPDKSLYYYSSDVLNGIFLELKVSF